MTGQIIERFPDIGVEIYQASRVYFFQSNEETEKHRIKEKFPITSEISSINQAEQPWQKVLLAKEPDRLADVEEYLRSVSVSLQVVRSEPQFLELLPRGSNKGTALDRLVEILGLSQASVIAMGNNLNDVELIQAAGTGIAVANAHDELKKHADFCCCHHDEHAVAEIIRWIETSTGSKKSSLK